MRYRKGVIVTSVAVVAAALAGCSQPAPQVDPPTVRLTGISVNSTDHSVAVRDLAIADNGPRGYPAGSKAPLTMKLWNNTDTSVALTGLTTKDGAPVELVSGTGPDATFSIPIPPGTPVELLPGGKEYLRIACLPRDFLPGMTMAMTFTFDNGATVAADVPMAGDNPVVPQVAPNAVVSGGPGTAPC